MFPFAFTLALCSLAAGIAGGLALRLLPSLRLRLAGLALLASGLPLVAVVASGLIMFDTRHDALVTLIAADALGPERVTGVVMPSPRPRAARSSSPRSRGTPSFPAFRLRDPRHRS